MDLTKPEVRQETPVFHLSDNLGNMQAFNNVFPKLEHKLIPQLLKQDVLQDEMLVRSRIIIFDPPFGKHLNATKQEFLANLLMHVVELSKVNNLTCLCFLPFKRAGMTTWLPIKRWSNILRTWHPDSCSVCSCKVLKSRDHELWST